MKRKRGLILDTIYHPDFPYERRAAIAKRIRALFSTELGKQVLADLDKIVTPSVFPYDELGNHSSYGALAVQEAERNFLMQLKALRDYDERTDPGAKRSARDDKA